MAGRDMCDFMSHSTCQFSLCGGLQYQSGIHEEKAAREGESNWREMQADLNRHIQRVRQRMDAKKAAVDADVADADADWAEADAEDAIAFALSAITEAEYATLDAMLAREDAAKLAARS